MKYRILPFILLLANSLTAQIKVEEWRDHLNYNTLIDLIEKDNRIIAASTTALFYMDKTTKEINHFSTLDGLSEIEITSLAYDKTRNIILIGYKSGNLDVIIDGEIKNIPEILNTTNITGSKQINHIQIEDNYALLSCNFGIIKFDLEKVEISDTYKLGVNNTNKAVQQATVFKDTIYAATDHGIFKAYADHPLLSFSDNWSKMHFKGVLPDSSDINTIASTSDYLMFNWTSVNSIEDKQYVYENNQLIISPSNNNFKVNSLKSENNKILLSGLYNSRLYNSSTNFENLIIHGDLNFTNSIVGIDGSYWFTDVSRGLIKADPAGFQSYFPHGPKSTNISKIISDQNEIIITHGGKHDSYAPKYSRDNFSIYKDNIWTYYPTDPIIDERDVTAFAQDPLNPENQWSTTWGLGLLKYTDYSSPEVYTQNNSTLAPRDFGEEQYLLSDLKFDNKGTLWVLSSQSPRALISKDKDDNWEYYNFGSLLPTITHTKRLEIFNQLNQKWIIPEGDGILVFDESQTSSKVKQLNTSSNSGNLPSLKVNCATIDHNGKVWIGSEEGLSVILTQEIYLMVEIILPIIF